VNLLKPGAVLVRNFQNRVLWGTASFVGMLLLVGWISVSEPARMDVFTQQYHGRSIENGALLFLNNCATCHGIDGKGIQGKAPALNNPMLFLKDNPARVAQQKVTDLTNQQKSLQTNIETYNKNVQALAAANERLKTVTPGSEEEQKLKAEIDGLNGQIMNFDLARTQKQIDDMTAQIQQAQAEVDQAKADGWDPTRDTRLTELKWSGRLQDYIISTVISGRPVSSLYWPQPMPAWGQQSGGPMRMDEIIDVANYILNFQDTAVKLKPKDIHQEFKMPSGGAIENAVGDVDVTTLDLAGGDPALGQQVYTTLACGPACHQAGLVAPPTAGTYTRVVNERLNDPANAGKTPEQYLADSIIHPNNYVVPNFAPGVMPQDFANKLTLDDLKNLIAFLATQQ
jgi:hypothetical protein